MKQKLSKAAAKAAADKAAMDKSLSEVSAEAQNLEKGNPSVASQWASFNSTHMRNMSYVGSDKVGSGATFKKTKPSTIVLIIIIILQKVQSQKIHLVDFFSLIQHTLR